MADEKKERKTAEEQVEEIREKEAKDNEAITSQKMEARDYFQGMGLSPRIERNDFTAKDAMKTFAKAKDALEANETNKRIVTGILDKAYQILRLLT